MKMWLNGCFDILHHGHFKLIQHAASFGGEVIIGIDSDKRVKKMKGEGRPFHSENERAFNLNQIKGVGDVVRQRPGQPHQLEAITKGVIFEVSTQHFDSDSYRVWKGDTQ